MTLARLLRCHPWGTSGLDLVPPSRPAGAHWYLPWRYARWRGTNGAIETAGTLDVATRPQPPVPLEPNNY
jgi:hypothetical protein